MLSQHDPRFTHVYSSAELCNRSLTEYYFISSAVSNTDELELLNGPPFSMYRVALQYCFNAEYNKLLEEKLRAGSPNNHIASIFNLNTFLYKTEGDAFKDKYQQNLPILGSLSNSEYAKKQRLLRDKKFSHSDAHEVNNPLQIPALTDGEIQKGFEDIDLIYQVINTCAGHFDYAYSVRIPYNDDRTRNFIKFHAIYKKYYFKHYLDAIREGFGLP